MGASALLGNRALFTFSVDGAGELGVVRFRGVESISQPFEFRLELAGPDVDLGDLVDQLALLTIRSIDTPRQVHGYICHAEYTGQSRNHHTYEVTLVPKLWRLQHRTNSRIFQKQTTKQILAKVLEEAGISKEWHRFELFGAYEPRDYCVQYHESDLAFVQRLLEEDGIHYYFEHHGDKHVLVMRDDAGAPAIHGEPAVWFSPPQGYVRGREHVTRFRVAEGVRPGKVSLRDHNLHRPDQPMGASESAPTSTELEVYDFPGEYQDNSAGGAPNKGPKLAKMRLEELQVDRRVGHGGSDCPRLTPGHAFKLTGFGRGDFDSEYRLVRVRHKGEQPQALEQDAEGAFSYDNDFTCVEKKVAYRPPRVTARPKVAGVQTATVVGPPNEEIYVDEHARVKVQFHWDRSDQFNEHASCWVRVSQVWAGNAWGGMFIPRIGHEVLVDFIEGDPDRPIITGRIYHGLNAPPYPLPDQKTKSTIKSDTYQGGGYNELRFEDQKGLEQIFMHAQRDLDIRVLHDRMESVLSDRHLTVGSNDRGGKVGDLNEHVYHDHSVRVDRNRDEHIGGDIRQRVGGIDGVGHVDVIVEGNRRELVLLDQSLEIKGEVKVKVHGSDHTHVVQDVHRKVDGSELVHVARDVHVAATKVVIEASQGITLRSPGGFITLHRSGIDIQGVLVRINSGGSALTADPAAPKEVDEVKQAQPTTPKPADSGGV